MEKIRYTIDPHNRLILHNLNVPRFRKILDGKFGTNGKNSITYHVKNPQDSNVPQQVKLSGNYSLDKNHNLVLTLDKWNNQIENDKLTIKSELLDAKSNELAFSVSTKDIEDRTSLYILKLAGRWRADKYNRLAFDITKEKGPPDGLTLKGGWQINKRNELIYTYKKSYLKKKEKLTRAITFKGYWDIKDKHRLSYVLNKEINSQFDFRIAVGKLTKRGLAYQIGIGAVPVNKQISLFGEWKISKRLGLIFEVPYENRAARRISIGAAYKLIQGEAFLKALKSGREITFTAGVGFRW